MTVTHSLIKYIWIDGNRLSINNGRSVGRNINGQLLFTHDISKSLCQRETTTVRKKNIAECNDKLCMLCVFHFTIALNRMTGGWTSSFYYSLIYEESVKILQQIIYEKIKRIFGPKLASIPDVWKLMLFLFTAALRPPNHSLHVLNWYSRCENCKSAIIAVVSFLFFDFFDAKQNLC